MADGSDEDLYEVLQVSRKAEREVIAAAYKRLARKYHPDASTGSPDDERMKRINAAYDVLHDPQARAAYDREGADAPPAREPAQQGPETKPAFVGLRARPGESNAPASSGGGCSGLLVLLVCVGIACVVYLATRHETNETESARHASSEPAETPAQSDDLIPRTVRMAHEIIWPDGTTGACSSISMVGAFSATDESRLRAHFHEQNASWAVGDRRATVRSIESCSRIHQRVRGTCTRSVDPPGQPPGAQPGIERVVVYDPGLARRGPEWCLDEGGVWSRP